MMAETDLAKNLLLVEVGEGTEGCAGRSSEGVDLALLLLIRAVAHLCLDKVCLFVGGSV